MVDEYTHYFVAKLVIFNEDTVLLARRSGEEEYDNVWNYPGGRKERTDNDILACLQREKREELGDDVTITVYHDVAHTTTFTRTDGMPVVIGCYPATYENGTVHLGDGYSEKAWVDIERVTERDTTPGMYDEIKRCRNVLQHAHETATV